MTGRRRELAFERESLILLARLREQCEAGHPDLADETSSVLSRDTFLALIQAVEAIQNVVFHRAADGTISVVSGLAEVEQALRRFG